MSRIGERINKALRTGLTFTINRDSGDLSGEYCMLELNAQATKPFIKEFFLSATFGYDTEARAGDKITSSDGRHLMVMTLTPEILKDSVAAYDGVCYKCNVSGQLYRYSGEATWDDDYDLVAAPVLIKSDCYGLLTEALYGNDLNENRELGNLGLQEHELYIPSSVGVEIHDRYQVSSGEYYRIETIAKRRYENIDVAIVGEDTR